MLEPGASMLSAGGICQASRTTHEAGDNSEEWLKKNFHEARLGRGVGYLEPNVHRGIEVGQRCDHSDH